MIPVALLFTLATAAVRRQPGEPLPSLEPGSTQRVADWRQLGRWGLSEKRLPVGTKLLYRTSDIWERDRQAILAAVAIFAGQSVLIGLLLLERRGRRRAQAAVEEQAVYERTLADLRIDGVRHALAESPEALVDALARIGQYAGASRAVLQQSPEASTLPPQRFTWAATANGAHRNGSATGDKAAPSTVKAMEIPLIADGAPMGTLELYPAPVRQLQSELLVRRLGTAGGVIASAIARARSAETIRRGEALNRAVLASLPMRIAILDQAGVIIRVNDAWRDDTTRCAGPVDRNVSIGESYLDECRRVEARGRDEARAAREGIENVLARRIGSFLHEYHISSPKPRWYEMRVDPLEYDSGGAIITHLDITDRRIAELHAEQTRRQVAHMGRVTMIGELAAGVSHELRQPLAAIRANAEAGALLLVRKPVDLDELAHIFRDIEDDDTRAAAILDDIRLLLRKESPAIGPVDLNEVCRHAVQLIQRDALLRRVELDLVLEPRLPAVIGDPIELEQVVLNLLLNAIDSAAMSTGVRSVIVSTTRDEGAIELSVRDTGPGFSADVEEHLFESFFSTKAQGLGMGLAIVRSIIERHRGQVYGANLSNGGAVFRISIPTCSRLTLSV